MLSERARSLKALLHSVCPRARAIEVSLCGVAWSGAPAPRGGTAAHPPPRRGLGEPVAGTKSKRGRRCGTGLHLRAESAAATQAVVPGGARALRAEPLGGVRP